MSEALLLPNVHPFPKRGANATAARKVLVVDDHEDSRFMLRYLLESSNYTALEAADGLEALEIAQRERPDLILMDVSLPRLNGLATTQRIRADDGLRRTPVVIMSGYVTPHDRRAAFDAGCDDFIAKPFEFSELTELLNRLLHTRSDAA